MTNSRAKLAAALAASVMVLGGCGHSSPSASSTASSSATAAPSETSTGTADTAAQLDATTVHTIAVTVDDSSLSDMIQVFLDTGEKEWIHGSVTIDGETFTDVGLKLKGNSSLRGISVDTPAQDLPFRIRLDKYVDDQQFKGISDFTVRSNSSETSMNEAVALDLLTDAGLASTQAIATRFSVNGGDETLRLTVQNLDDTWVHNYFPDAGADSVLYKSESDGTWDWNGEDGDYSSSFDIEAGADNYAPLIALLDLINNGTEEEIAAQLPDLVDIDSFATYLAFEDVINNFDNIDGPGNNSYLFWDSATNKFTVVAWDHNLAFGGVGGGMPGMGGDGAMPEGGRPDFGDGTMPEMPEGGIPEGGRPDFGNGTNVPEGEMPEGFAPPEGAPEGFNPGAGNMGGPGMSRSNPLVTAFQANADWSALYDAKLAELQASLIDGGALATSVENWTATLESGASDLVSSETITSEGEAILGSNTTESSQ